jgi:hypothetical protein
MSVPTKQRSFNPPVPQKERKKKKQNSNLVLCSFIKAELKIKLETDQDLLKSPFA